VPVGRFGTRWRLVRPHWRLLAEALAALVWCRIVLYSVAFKRLAPGLGLERCETPGILPASEEATARQVRHIVGAIARRLPWHSTCLVRAMAAGRLLKRRGLPYTLYLGVSGGRPPLDAHAWLRSGAVYVTGEEEAANFHAVSWFGSA
jgi:hypothetical protein